ncbi:restriction endonuclease subunit S [Cronobacter sakazakii]|uniref:restriction endonuclease subunit S n=2 Tax=Enterobacteriaceae TaxID=543 RepID=UPI000D707246|nr:restriction endonuclease subunit S [Cronobacter sakazakii]MBR9957638.1 restriction endonuclease subunit S [Cronobacter sakazakii]PWV30103.1 restriction endonuclease subunit S [Cronobacter sakazakii]
MSMDKKVPEIRFNDFGEEWNGRCLGSLCLIGDIDHRMPESKTTGIPYLMTGDFCGINGLDFKNAKLISIEDYELLSKKIKPEYGDILFARYASVGSVRYVETKIDFLISYSCAIIKTNNTSYGKFLFYCFQTDNTQKKIELDINTGSQRNIGIDSLKNLFVFLPKSEEQIVIGNYFQKLDSLIIQHQQKHDKLSNIKKSMLDKMFPKQGEKIPEIRFKGFSEEWKEKTLGEIGATYTGLSGKTKDDFGHGQARFVTYLNVFSNAISNENSVEPIEFDTNQNEVKKGDVFFTTSSETPEEVGMSSVWMSEIKNVYLNSFCFGYRPIQKLDNYYIAYLLRSNSFRNKIVFLAQGISRYNISKTKVMDIKISIPELSEQEKIGNYFQKLETLIKHHQQQITQLNNIKQACLSKMYV